ncbi:protein BREAST CANCER SUSCEPTIBILITY 1 homolog [Andrographis paniculata]|uniref:protein BREAST CANCER SUSCEPTIBILITY 1 homolog n=1 Tax=Andrographis paniculata TaxID=175694 RepID=UPI0021E84904|nr:protein BREAST CANCER SUSCEPTIBILITY 1 homolog [Andrographis paniculata]
MADTSHLERMGRELKCPICLSLLNSAVSLSCNHVFCNSCIEKSMKAASNCPVCKVPFRRREIRPAQHMDNLVSVYKSMEVASGVNIFVTQNADSTKASDERTGINNCEAKDVVQAGHNRSQQKGLKGAVKTNKRPAGSNSNKPSFPTKKRVQVPQCSDANTQTDPEKLEGGIHETERQKPEKCPVLQRDMSCRVENGVTVFSPFFWLRDEEDLEKSSQHSDDNQLLHTPPNAPCFSDIKDSDDEDTSKRSDVKDSEDEDISTRSERQIVSPTRAQFIDSEMFDWTQRPCSPELCYSPPAMQQNDYAAEQETLKKAEATLMETAPGSKQCAKNRKSLSMKTTHEAPEAKNMKRTSTNDSENATKIRKDKRRKKTMSEVTVPLINPDMVRNQDTRESKEENSTILREKPQESKKVCSAANINERCGPHLHQRSEPQPNGNEAASVFGSPSVNLQKSNEGSSNSEKSDKRSNTKITRSQPLKTDKHIKRSLEENSTKTSSSLKKVKFSVEGNCDSTPVIASTCGEIRDQTSEESQGAINQKRMKVPAKKGKPSNSLDGSVLVRCHTSPSTICCAFCQSSEETEASGSLVQYVNGKLVEDNHSAKTEGIHVHKYCAEWAPNVYFEDDSIINLETELSRSRRITCSCCGTKGAALGCYEKSCRKSFHVTCARLTPECRWDYEHFVMLCPVHASCQLPGEMSQSQSRQQKNSAVKRKPVVQIHQVKSTDDCKHDSTLHWKSQKKLKNLILCSSGLTAAEKEIVTEFTKLSGVTIIKNWDTSVTHVIASTDENGACRRTLKFLMGVLEGKWILNVQWIKACMAAGELVDEECFEISVDIHGIRDGPKLGRLRHLNKQPKLFEGCTVYFMGDFEPSYKGYLHNLVIAGGGKVLNRKPVAKDETSALNKSLAATTFVIYSVEVPDQHNPSSILKQRRSQAEAVASSAGAVVATNSWILNSISGCRLQEICGRS